MGSESPQKPGSRIGLCEYSKPLIHENLRPLILHTLSLLLPTVDKLIHVLVCGFPSFLAFLDNIPKRREERGYLPPQSYPGVIHTYVFYINKEKPTSTYLRQEAKWERGYLDFMTRVVLCFVRGSVVRNDDSASQMDTYIKMSELSFLHPRDHVIESEAPRPVILTILFADRSPGTRQGKRGWAK